MHPSSFRDDAGCNPVIARHQVEQPADQPADPACRRVIPPRLMCGRASGSCLAERPLRRGECRCCRSATSIDGVMAPLAAGFGVVDLTGGSQPA